MGKAIAKVTAKLPARWNYNASVRRMRRTVWKWRNLTASMLRELHIAHEKLSMQGARTDLRENSRKSWTGYCRDIGIDPKTAWNWLQRYDPGTNRLLEAPRKSGIRRVRELRADLATTANVPALRPAITLPIRQIRHGVAVWLRNLARRIDAK